MRGLKVTNLRLGDGTGSRLNSYVKWVELSCKKKAAILLDLSYWYYLSQPQPTKFLNRNSPIFSFKKDGKVPMTQYNINKL